MSDDIVEFVKAQLQDDEDFARQASELSTGQWQTPATGVVDFGLVDPDLGVFGLQTFEDGRIADHIVRHNPARILTQVAFMRRIVELHTTGVYRTYQCSNADHIQEWQCERANEPYTEYRYCEVCGGSECVEVPLLAGIWAGRPGFKDEWRLA